jgi:putative ABC transport system substrate-binding protein
MFLQEARLIAAQALKHRLPTGSVVRDFAEAGLLMSYGPSVVDNFRRAAAYMDKILKGAR